ncbi:MAG: 1-acyl-sn-glycerol-3-phosphate acyltransferase [Pseudomonadota bacterium]
MGATIELPIWFFGLIVVFAAVTFASHFLFPSVRWFFRGRAEKVVSRLNERLERPIEPFKLARRYDTIQRLIYDPEVAQAVVEHAAENGLREDVAFEEARRYAQEIVPSFSATAYFKLGTRGAKWLSRGLYRVRLGHFDEALSEVSPDATVVFVMNHRSNMDYVLVTYLAAQRSALSYAVGEWARVWPLSRLIRSMGAYFIRRRSRSALYRKVLARYVQMATAGGVTQAIFPEGGLSLDGRTAAPKLGLLNYVLAGAEVSEKDVVFVPVALNYDRVLEDRILMAAGERGERRFRAKMSVVAGFILRQFWLRITGRFYRFGYAAVSFGSPVSLAALGETTTEEVAEKLMDRIREVVPVVPIPLVALAVLNGARTRSDIELFAKDLLDKVPEAHVHLPRDSVAYAVEVGLRGLELRDALVQGDMIEIKDEALVNFYAASIEHFWEPNVVPPEPAKKQAETSAA